ncbi:MAG: hypothetical protein Q8P68_04980 [Candidatus Peregrinibacteria bacterium]|nr:hypothetical protein [Candidatus Peregrinibacteria bacterium]MDZ4244448.1 hypothetical protein [Candidatus Gracilibacteria bacterium]
MVEDLISQIINDANPSQVERLDGEDGLIRAFEDTLKIPNTTLLCYGTVKHQTRALPSIFPNYYAERVKRNISTRCLIPADAQSLKECIQNDVAHLRTTRFIGRETTMPVEINIYGDSVAIMSFEDNFAVIIRSKTVADCMRIIFELAYDSAKESDIKVRERFENVF